MPALRQLLLEQPSNPHGIHEAMARYAEFLFGEYKGVVALACGKRVHGPFLNLSLPDEAARDDARLLDLAASLAVGYDLRLVSVLAPVAGEAADALSPRLGAILVTADDEGFFHALSWMLRHSANGDIERYSRARFADCPLANPDRWAAIFKRDRNPDAQREALDRLGSVFGR